MNQKKAFTLIEILIVLAILAILASLMTGNLLNSLKKGRDARRKADLAQIQKTLEMYYEDKKAYPLTAILVFGSSLADSISGKIYMQELPNDPKTTCSYAYISNGTSYQLYAHLENTLDTGQGVDQAGYTSADCDGTATCLCRFGLASSNTTP